MHIPCISPRESDAWRSQLGWRSHRLFVVAPLPFQVAPTTYIVDPPFHTSVRLIGGYPDIPGTLNQLMVMTTQVDIAALHHLFQLPNRVEGISQATPSTSGMVGIYEVALTIPRILGGAFSHPQP